MSALQPLRQLLKCVALALVLGGAPTPAAADSVATLKRFLAETRAFDAEFTQTIYSARGRTPQQSSGRVAIQRPGRFRWEVSAPFAQLLVGDGERVWLYDPELEQVSVRRMSDALGGTPAALLAGDGSAASLEAAFNFADDGERDGLQWVEARPKASDASFARVRLGLAGGTLRAMELHDHFGQVTAIGFGKLRRNPQLPEGHFRFQVPPGVDVIGE